LTRREFTALLKKDDADDHFIAASWCDAQGNLRLQSAEQAGDFPPPAYNKLISAVLEACGMGKQAIDDAKKD
jgi:hypothetical protein